MLAACAGDSPSETGDDEPAARSFGATCTTASNASTECDSKICTDSIDMIGHPVCSQQCTVGDNSTCPSGSKGMMCNKKGYCRP
jgi:hypothetical protein